MDLSNEKPQNKDSKPGIEDDAVKYKNADLPTLPEKTKREMEKTQTELDEFKKKALKEFPSILSIGIVPPQAVPKFEEEMKEEVEIKEKLMHLILIIPEEKYKDIPKIKPKLIEMIKDKDPKIWLHIITPVDVWNYCLDSKFDIVEAIGLSFPLHDRGLLGALRVANIHKSLVLRKFEKYIVSYVIAGSLVTGTATKTSDVDVYIVIDDTDVKRMPRLELKEKLRSIINSYVMQAEELAGVKNKLSPQVYILTDFWESVKDAHPVIFTFIRDGVPLYDRGAFLPWKSLLKMGKIKPSPEAIDMFMSMGDKVSDSVKRRLLDLVTYDIYWGVITPSQAVLMLYGCAPPKPKETAPLMEELFVKKEKILEKKYVNILEKIVKIYKDYEHEKIKEMKGAEVDKLLAEFEDYMKRLKVLREEIEKKVNEKTVVRLYGDVFKLLKALFGSKPESQLVRVFEGELVNTGKAEAKFVHVLNELIKVNKNFKKEKYNKNYIEDIRKNATQLISQLIEYGQRCELANMERTKMTINLKDGKADLFLTEPAFLIKDDEIFKVTDTLEVAEKDEFDKALISMKENKKLAKISDLTLSVLKREFGDFDLSL
ncbi:hypothetical protein COV15_02925 [Candidatus Woesearchaeota archaeon CG10_big_fil_rev_8_21_14_0_10_34_12]|nr:MAG: hypothetical protein COV15_02925 [Candidatus Woesearchaeota archaeon CG10_big_fil_rev_8_21_14_0_10_34_12]